MYKAGKPHWTQSDFRKPTFSYVRARIHEMPETMLAAPVVTPGGGAGVPIMPASRRAALIVGGEREEDVLESEHASFLAEQAAAAAAEEAAALARHEAASSAADGSTGYREAMSVIDASLASADAYNAQMGALAGAPLAALAAGAAQPASLSGGRLRPYQLAGLRWLIARFLTSESGIIADEMGLGKTVQVIALLSWLHDSRQYQPSLIVVPLTTVGNWIAEFARFAPTLPTVRYRGDAATRAALRAAHIPREALTKSSTAALAAPMPVFIAAYSDAVRDAAELSRVRWRVLVLDEGHRIKNEASVTRRVLRCYAPPERGGAAVTKILLTGTPVQNDVLELWSLCNFIMPQVFRAREEFLRIYRFAGLANGAADRSYYLAGEERDRIVSKLHSLLSRYMLRRTKGEANLRLPPKVEVLVYTPLAPEQIRLLRALERGCLAAEVRRLGWLPAGRLDDEVGFVEAMDAAAAEAAAANGAVAGGSGNHSSSDALARVGARGLSTNSLQMQARKLCCHPFWVAEPPLPPGTATDARIVTACGKLSVLDRMLRSLAERSHKVLIFSQFTTVLAILEDYLAHAGEALGAYRVLHGGTAEAERDAAIRDFNSDPSVFAFLLSTKAGGQGINLVAADTVIFYDSDWNPTADAQAMDRAHRIGQRRPVVVYRLVTEGASVERRMLRKAAAKGSLARMVLQEGAHTLRSIAGGPVDTDADDVGSAPAAIGQVTPALLRYWLRDGVSDEILLNGGIRGAELEAILDRRRAVQAGLRVATEVEGRLIEETAAAKAATDAKTSSSLNADAISASSRSEATPSPPPVGRKRSRGCAGSVAAEAFPSSRLAAAAGVSGDKSSPPTLRGVDDLDEFDWQAWASEAPHTPSAGDGYSFVYQIKH